jgi:hypothetical protein
MLAEWKGIHLALVRADCLDTSAPDYLIEGIIPSVGIGFVWGPSRVGKSLLVNGEMALSVVNGVEFFGRATTQGSVVVCLGEGLYDAGVRKHARIAREHSDRMAIAEHIASDARDAGRGIEWLEMQPEYSDDGLFYMTEPFVLPLEANGEPSPSLRAAVGALQQIPDLKLVILDSLGDFTPSLSISNDASANRIIQGMKLLARELDCVVLAVAHPLRDGSRMLGAGRLFNAADFVIRVQSDPARPGMLQEATVSCDKNKYGPMFKPFGYEIMPYSWHEPDGTAVQSATVREREEPEPPALLRRVV